MGGLVSLVRLRCGNNSLDSLPNELGALSRLEDFSFNANQVCAGGGGGGGLRRGGGIALVPTSVAP